VCISIVKHYLERLLGGKVVAFTGEISDVVILKMHHVTCLITGELKISVDMPFVLLSS